MQIRKLGMLGVMAIALAMPGMALAGSSGTKHGIGKGGVPALREKLQGEIDALDARLSAIEGQFADNDGDTFSEAQGDCDDTNPAVNPNATEVAGNSIDDDCDHLIDEP